MTGQTSVKKLNETEKEIVLVSLWNVSEHRIHNVHQKEFIKFGPVLLDGVPQEYAHSIEHS